MDTEEDIHSNYYSNGYLQDPLQDFIDDVLQNQALSPNYDTGKFLIVKSWHFTKKINNFFNFYNRYDGST